MKIQKAALFLLLSGWLTGLYGQDNENLEYIGDFYQKFFYKQVDTVEQLLVNEEGTQEVSVDPIPGKVG